MSLFVGTNLEVIKEVTPRTGEWKNVVIGKSLKTKSAKDKEGICGMCWKNRNEESFFYVTKGRRIKKFCLADGQTSDVFHCEPESGTSATALCSLDDATEKFFLGTDDGTIHLCNMEEVELKWSSGSHVQVLRHSADQKLVLTGGRESDVKLWDVSRLSEAAAPQFSAKNVRPDDLCLRRPIWVTDGHFFPDRRRVVVTSGHSDVRVYDPNCSQRRPVLECKWGEDPITCMSLCEGLEEKIFVGNSKGQVAGLDLRRRGAVTGHFKKISGSVRALSCGGPGDPALFSCSSDRFLRVHHLESREMLKEVYLKLKPLVLLASKSVAFLEKSDEVWDSMPSVKDARKRKIK